MEYINIDSLQLNLPKLIKDQKSWIVWSGSIDQSTGKVVKKPVNGNGWTTDKSKWLSFDKAIDYIQESGRKNLGIGLVFTEKVYNSGLTCIDLDVMPNGELGKMLPERRDYYIKQLDTYTEYSPSKIGCHCWGLTTNSVPNNHEQKHARFENSNLEIFKKHGRFVTVTGNLHEHYGAYPLSDITKQVVKYLDKIGKKENNGKAKELILSSNHINTVDVSILPPIAKKLHEYGFNNTDDRSGREFSYFFSLAHITNCNKQLMGEYYAASMMCRQRIEDGDFNGKKSPGYINRTIDNAILTALNNPDEKKEKKPDKEIYDLINILNSIIGTDSIFINEIVLTKIMSKTVWDEKNNSFRVLDNNGILKSFPKTEIEGAIGILFGSLYDKKCLSDYYKAVGKKETLANAPYNYLKTYIMSKRQVASISYSLDIFSIKPYIELIDDHELKVNTVFDPKKYSDINYEIIAGYKEHFPYFDDLIDFICYSKVATSRKNCFLWINCCSNWGKGFLINRMENIGLAFTTNQGNILSTIQGKPSGISVNNLNKSCALVIDEFSYAAKELKDICESIKINIKGGSLTEVDVYAKIFFSADNVESLTSGGVEDQMANRFSYWNFSKHGKIDNKKFYKNNSPTAINNSIDSYMSKRVNDNFRKFREIGKEEASNEAKKYIDKFHDNYGISNMHGSLSDSFETIADDFLNWCRDIMRVTQDKYLNTPNEKNAFSLIKNGGINHIIITRPQKVLSLFMLDCMLKDEYYSLTHKIKDILEIAKHKSGSNSEVHKYNGSTYRGIKISLKSYQDNVTEIIQCK